MVEFLGYRFAFNAEDFEQRVTAAAVKLGLVEDNDLDEDETEDLVELAADGLIEEPRSSLGRYLVRHWEQLSLVRGESLVYWLRKLVFRGAWLDHRVKEGLLDVDWNDEEGEFALPRPARRPGAPRARSRAVVARSPVPPLTETPLSTSQVHSGHDPGSDPAPKAWRFRNERRTDHPQSVELPGVGRAFVTGSDPVVPSREEQLLSQAADDTAAAMLSEARGLLLRGWSKGAQARDARGHVVHAWSDDAAAWSLVGALLASWHRHDDRLDADFVAHSVEARALADATKALADATGTLAIDPWNDAPERKLRRRDRRGRPRARAARPPARRSRLEERFCLLRSADVLAAELRHDPAARRALDEPELEEVRLVDVLDRVRLLAEGHGQRGQADRAAVEAVDDRVQERAVGALEPVAVDLEQRRAPRPRPRW